MALLYFTGFETGTIAEGLLITGNCTVSSTDKRSGTYSLKIVGDGATANWVDIRPYDAAGDGSMDGNFSTATIYVTFWANFSAQTSDPATILRAWSLANSMKATLRRNLDGSLALYNKDDTLVATSTTLTSTGTWYKIYLKIGTSSADIVADAPYELRINGVSEFSGTMLTLSSQHSHLRVGNLVTADTYTWYLDDFAIDSAAFLENYKVDALVPNANGTFTDSWTPTAGALWECIDERPASDTDRISRTADPETTRLYTANLTASSTIGITAAIPIHAVRFIVRSANTDSLTHAQFIRGYLSGTSSETPASGGPPIGGVYRHFGIMWTQDFNAATAWTSTTLDALEVGISLGGNYTTGTHRCSQIIAEVIFAESEGGQVTDCLLLGNHIAQGSGSGILIDAVQGLLGANKLSGISIVGNVCRDNTWDGIGLPFPQGTNAQAAPDRSTLCGNVVCRNNQKGISLDGGYGGTDYLDYLSICGNICSDDPRSADQQDTGIWIQTKMRYTVVMGNVAMGNAWAAAITDGALYPATNQIAHNMTDD